jgi:hypothetical protein
MKDTVKTEVDNVLVSLQAQLQSGSIMRADHDTAVSQLSTYRTDMLTNMDRRGACPALAAYNYAGYPAIGGLAGSIIPADDVWTAGLGGGAPLVTVSLVPPPGSLLTYNDLLPAPAAACAANCLCAKMESVAAASHRSRLETMQNNLIARLDRNGGRLGAQKERKLALLKQVLESQTELYDFIVDLSKGLEPLNNPEEAVLDDVIAVYVDGPLAFGVNGQPNIADSMLKRTTILDLNLTSNANAVGELAERCQARILQSCSSNI